MKSLKELRSQINEVLKSSDPIEKWIDDFVHSKNPKFASKTKSERIDMAKGAYYGAQKNESVAVSQNSTAEVSMNEDHLVHVNDGSKYDEEPHEKDVEHVMAGVKLHGGEHAGASDKGVFFKFKSPEHASSFAQHVNKCPHGSCDAHMSEAVEYKGIGTDMVDKKKKLNPQPNFTTAKKQVKDFKEEAEQIDEGENGLAAKAKKSGISLSTLKTVYKRGVAAWNSGHRPGTTPQQWGMARVNSYITKGSGTYGGADKDLHEDARLDKKEYHKGMSDSTAKARVAHWKNADKLSDSNPKAYEPAPGDKDAKTTPSVHTKKYHAMYGEAKVYDPFTEETEQIDELSKDTLSSYAKKASHDARIKQHVAADFKSKEAHARNPRKKETWGSIAKKYQSKAWKREDGHDKAVDKLAKESYDHGPIDRDAKVATGHKVAVLAGSGLDSGKHGTIVGSSKERTGDMWHIKTSSGDIVKMHKHRVAKLKEDLELIAKHEVKANAPHKSGGHVILTKASNKWHVLHNKKSSPKDKDLHRSKLLHSYADEKEARAKFKELHEEQIDEVSKSTLMRYIPSASRDVADNVYSAKDQINRSTEHTRAGDWDASKTAHTKATTLFNKANKRIKGIDTATKKLGTQKEEVELDEAIAKKLPVQHAVDAVTKTFNTKTATRFLSHLKPGTDKHTTWDKVNAALVKQGVQTHHIASIAQKTSHMNEETIEESRGHKVLATFFKNREVAQRAFTGDKQVPKYLEKGIETPEKDAVEKKRMLGMKEGFLSKSEEQDMKNLDAYSFYKKYGRNKAKHRASHATKTSDVEKYTEETVVEGFDDYHAIAKELVKRHGKNVDTGHISDIEGERDSHRPLDRAEVMHHVNKVLGSKQVKEAEVHDDTWKEYKPNKQSIVKALKKN
jgi:hypothetical protein